MVTSQRKVVSVFFLLFVFSAFFLFWQNEQELNPNQNKSWWTLSFADPNNGGSFDFVIENYGAGRAFTYRVERGSTLLEEAAFDMEAGNKRTVHIQGDENLSEERLRIEVSSGEERKEIYR